MSKGNYLIGDPLMLVYYFLLKKLIYGELCFVLVGAWYLSGFRCGNLMLFI